LLSSETMNEYSEYDNSEMIDEWRLYAYCVGLDWAVFFPQRGESVQQARNVCMHCVVAFECLEDALARKESAGVRAGLSTAERRRIVKARKEGKDTI